LGALNLDEHINLLKKFIIVDRTLTKDENGKIKIGTTTKTGKRQKKVAKRNINFNLFSEELYELVINDQIQNARSNVNNTENLLFCTKDGHYIRESSITNIFKRICREAGIKLELTTGCFIHMTRHTGISFMICMRF